MRPISPAIAAIIAAAFLVGFFFQLLYQRWKPPAAGPDGYRLAAPAPMPNDAAHEPVSLPATFVPGSAPEPSPVAPPLLAARDVEKIRSLAGKPARIRGRIFRVGHSVKSNTYFLNFGPSRDALTGVIFASAAELFDKTQFPPRNFEGREVEVHGEIKNHPQYGLEIILESPAQIKILDR
ncbi:MAG TPA: hypothetical protein VFU31_28550 [Candidatus Binatia bacterium]|nr:hypothetical protein [Candidatus Binatia bacterium]